jgi:hypothetical protein
LFLILTLLWTQVSAWASYPAASIAQLLLDSNAEGWIESTQNKLGELNARTKFRKVLSETQVVVPAVALEPASFANGTALFLALLMASRRRHLFRWGLTGYAALSIPHALSLVFALLYRIAERIPVPLLDVARWQLEGIGIANHFCILVLPTLAPVALWFWIDNEFLASLVANSSHSRHPPNPDQKKYRSTQTGQPEAIH